MSPLDRREFLSRLGSLSKLSAAAMFMSAHGVVSFGAASSDPPTDSDTRATALYRGPRIVALRLETASPLEEMADFYGQTLGLPVRTEAQELVVTAGGTELTFVPTSEPGAAPFYHFAFNIPHNKILAARDWQLERTPLFLTPENLRDPKYPNDIRHFRNWDAHSVFFWDPAGNVVEYIARHTLKTPGHGPFTSRDIRYVSEIAFVADDVPKAAADLEAALSLPQYQNAADVFHATGDERGLLLLFKRGRGIGDALRDRPAAAEVFRTRAVIRGPLAGTYAFPDGPFEIETLATR